MKGQMRFRLALLVSLGLALNSCQTLPQAMEQARAQAATQIRAEPPGDYYIGRRYYIFGYHFWGYIRRPGQPWSTAQLVVLNENQKLAPDRVHRPTGSDNNDEYKIRGYFTGDKVYELVSDSFLPEFVLLDYQLISTTPPPIFPSQLRPNVRKTDDIERPF